MTSAADTARHRREARRVQLQELSRRELLDAAETVFGDKGVHAATIKEIAELAGYAVGSVYSFFDSKDALVRAVLERRGDEMLDGIRRHTTGPGSSLERLVALARFEVDFFRDRPAFARMYLASSAVGDLVPVFAQEHGVVDKLDEAMSRTAALFAEGQAAGELCDGPPPLLARLLSGIVTAYQAVQGGDAAAVLSDAQFDALVRRTFGRGAGVTPTPHPSDRAKGSA